MQITYPNPETVSLKTRSETILLGKDVKIGSYLVPGAGEYDVASIQCEATYLEKGLLYLIRAEDLNLAFLSAVSQDVTKVDDVSNTDILILDLRSDNKAEELKPILKALEPAYLLLIGAGLTPELVKQLDLTTAPTSSLKVTRSSLPLEGTMLIPQS